ncbi:MAG: hypothetical protein JWQ35_1519, partial [Bacteriovoracaceae bacterium]|nr:hypothetical protein [Bacteriovoracaceae bacterium]
MKLWILSFLFLSSIVSASERTSETLDARRGLYRLLSADSLEKDSYHFITSMQFFQQDGMLKDTENSSVRDTKTTLGFGYALTPHIQLSANGGFNIASRTPRAAVNGGSSGTDAIDIVQGGAAITGVYDIGEYLHLQSRRFTAGVSVWIDFEKITRFIDSPNIIPTLIFSTDHTDHPVLPFRSHLNLGFRPANGARFYKDSAPVKDYDRFVTDTLNSWAWTAGLGIEFPTRVVNPSAEMHIVKTANSSFASTPKWVTFGLKGRPFPTRNIEIFGGADIGLSSFKATAAGQKPDAPVVPLWNAILGFSVSQFGLKETETSVSTAEYNDLKSKVAEQESVLQGLRKDIEYNILQGRVVDAITKKPLSHVIISFP